MVVAEDEWDGGSVVAVAAVYLQCEVGWECIEAGLDPGWLQGDCILLLQHLCHLHRGTAWPRSGRDGSDLGSDCLNSDSASRKW